MAWITSSTRRRRTPRGSRELENTMEIDVALARVREVEGTKPVDRTALIAVAALLATVTNAVAFMLPPLLPVITTSYAHNSVSAAVWIFAALTMGGGAGFVLIPRLTDMLSDRSI